VEQQNWASGAGGSHEAAAAAVRRWVSLAEDSPLYADFAARIADDREMLNVVLQISNVPPLNLLFGAVQLLLTDDDHLARWYPRFTPEAASPGPDAYAALRAFVLDREEQIVEIGCTRRTQTNEVRRSAAILPFVAAAVAKWDEPAHAIDIGASTGLNLCMDKYSYDYGSGVIGRDPLTLSCENRGGFATPGAVPAFASRTGLDLHPVDVDDEARVAWLEALVWPEHLERLERLRAAIAIRRTTEVTMVRGDATLTLPEVVAGLAPGPIVLWHTIATYQFSEDQHDSLDAAVAFIAQSREVARVAFEPRRNATHPGITVSLSPRSASPVAIGHSHGAWIDRPD